MNPQPSALLSQLSTTDVLMSATTVFAVAGVATAVFIVLLVAEEVVLYWRREMTHRPSAGARIRRA